MGGIIMEMGVRFVVEMLSLDWSVFGVIKGRD
jgi:hypothetical protein